MLYSLFSLFLAILGVVLALVALIQLIRIPIVFIPLIGLLAFGTYSYLKIDSNVLAILDRSPDKRASAGEILKGLGYSVSDEASCKFITCAAYRRLNILVESKEIDMLGTVSGIGIREADLFILNE